MLERAASRPSPGRSVAGGGHDNLHAHAIRLRARHRHQAPGCRSVFDGLQCARISGAEADCIPGNEQERGRRAAGADRAHGLGATVVWSADRAWSAARANSAVFLATIRANLWADSRTASNLTKSLQDLPSCARDSTASKAIMWSRRMQFIRLIANRSRIQPGPGWSGRRGDILAQSAWCADNLSGTHAVALMLECRAANSLANSILKGVSFSVSQGELMAFSSHGMGKTGPCQGIDGWILPATRARAVRSGMSRRPKAYRARARVVMCVFLFFFFCFFLLFLFFFVFFFFCFFFFFFFFRRDERLYRGTRLDQLPGFAARGRPGAGNHAAVLTGVPRSRLCSSGRRRDVGRRNRVAGDRALPLRSRARLPR